MPHTPRLHPLLLAFPSMHVSPAIHMPSSLEKPLPDEYGVSVFGDRSRADFLRTERRSSRVGLGACRRKGLGMGLYGSTGATTDQELQSALEVCELALPKDTEPQADAEALASLGHVGAVLGRSRAGTSRPGALGRALCKAAPETRECRSAAERVVNEGPRSRGAAPQTAPAPPRGVSAPRTPRAVG